jgi:integrase
LWRIQQLGEKPKRTWKEAVVRWLKESSDKVSHTDDIAALAFADQYLGNLMLDDINRSILDSLSSAKKATGVANSTVNRLMEVIRAILNRSEKEWEWLDKAPAVRMLPEPKRRIRWLTNNKANSLLNELPEHLAEMARFSLATGLRESNVTGLEWSQIDMTRKVAWIHADQAKAGKAIGVPLNSNAIEVLQRQMGKHSTRVFTYKSKPVIKANTSAWRKALQRAGITDFRWHDLRHTWASWHVQSGTPLHALQELGAWSDVRMVQKYAHLAPEHLSGYADNIVMKEGEREAQLAQI